MNKLQEKAAELLDEIRIHLARPDALIQLAILGLMTGVLAGLVIVLFRLMVEGIQDYILPGNGADNYEALTAVATFFLPIIGAIALAMMFRWGAGKIQVLGVANVMERMSYHQGHITERGFVLQFFGAAFAIISGHSVGREGPHIFLGAAAGSLMGQYLSLPNNTIRTFVACGAAAGVAASFNTPLAGVIFSLEVIMMEYTLASFIPVILAAVSATTISNLVFGNEPAFIVPVWQMGSVSEMLLVVVLGVIAGTVSAGFVHFLQVIATQTRKVMIEWRFMAAGLFMGFAGLLVPEVMGIGYDSVQLALNGEMALMALLLLVIAKLIATSVVVGLGVPGGMIGPTLFIGAMLGAAVAELAVHLSPELETHVGLFALLGMGAMMSASLQAPLAALTAMLELTDNPQIILPGMLAVVVSGLTSSELFRKESLFISMLKASGQDYNANPVLQTLRRMGVASIMDRNFIHVDREISVSLASKILSSEPKYLLIDSGDKDRLMMPAVELAKFVESMEVESEMIDLTTIPALRLQAKAISLQANCQEAYELFQQDVAEALFVERIVGYSRQRVYGVLTKDMVERAYLY